MTKLYGIILCGNDMGVCPVEDVDYVLIDEAGRAAIGDLAVEGDTDTIYDELAQGTVQVSALAAITAAARDFVAVAGSGGNEAPAFVAALAQLNEALRAGGTDIALLPAA